MNSFLELFTTEDGDIHMTEKQLVYCINTFFIGKNNIINEMKKQQPKRSPVADIDNQFEYVELDGFTLHKNTYTQGAYKVKKGYRFKTLEEAVEKFNEPTLEEDIFQSIQIYKVRKTIYYELRATDIFLGFGEPLPADIGVYIPCSNKKEVEKVEEVVEEEVEEEEVEEVEEVVAIPQEEEIEDVEIIEIGDEIHGYIEDTLDVWNMNTSEIVGKYDIEAQKIIFN